MRRELLACVIQKFNGYELLRNHLQHGERRHFFPIDVVYERTLDKKKTIFCFFAPSIHIAYRNGVEKIRKGQKHMDFTTARQCHYCNNYFIKSAEKIEKHLSCCAGKAGFTFSFGNGKIIDYQDNYKHLGDVLFSIYFDFETTTGSVVFYDAKMSVVSYCMVIVFHPELDIPRICVFRSYDQSADQLTSLSHFETLQYNFFADTSHYNRVNLKQLEDAAFSVQHRDRDTALAEMFSVELKFTVDCLKFWFDKGHKINNLEVKLEDKLGFTQKHPKEADTVCCLCDFSN